MAIMQYIGARYVPKFYEGSDGNAWDPGVSYEPLTIVTYIGSSWTSKKSVPASVGAPNLNPDYWVNTGNYNEQVAALTELVTGIESDVETMGLTVDGLEENVDTYGRKLLPGLAEEIRPNFLGMYDSFTTQIGSIAKYGDRMWTVDGVTAVGDTALTKQSNLGKIREWSFASGALIGTHETNTGHANSVCYHPINNCLYVAPTWDYSSGTRVNAYYLYKINTSTWQNQQIDLGTVQALGVAYDYVTGDMYVLGYDIKLYKFDIDTNILTQYLDLNDIGSNNIINPSTGVVSAPQDIAIYNGIMVWTTSKNQALVIDLNHRTLSGYYNFANVDSNNYVEMHESEGMNFDNAGHLLISYIRWTSGNVSAHSVDAYTYRESANFICEIPVIFTAPFDKFGLPEPDVNATINIKDIRDNWRLQDNITMNSIHMFNALINKTKRISFSENYDFTGQNPIVNVRDDLIINLNGKTLNNFRGFANFGGTMTIEGTGTVNLMDGYLQFLYAARGTIITTNSANITLNGVSATSINSYMNPGSLSQLIIDNATVTGDADLKINNVIRERHAVYSGGLKLLPIT